jgi:hypothetical protein
MARTVQPRRDRILTTQVVSLPQTNVFDVCLAARPCGLLFEAAGHGGRERVIDGIDCGFATRVRQAPETGRRRCLW